MKKNSQDHGEFSLIRDCFYRTEKYHPETTLGIGDDASLLQIPKGNQLVVSIDTMVEGVHFLQGTDPEALGHKLLAINLSDMAAMGADPVWATLALTIPENSREWLSEFSRGLFTLADQYQIDLVGGDTTRGPLTMTMQIHGWIPEGKAVRRSGAKPGDLICVTNSLGAAGFALQQIQEGRDAKHISHYLDRPTPRVEAGIILRNYATSMIDISDGLLADLSHILEQSSVGAIINLDSIPLHPAITGLAAREKFDLAMTAGDDYELCCTVSETLFADAAKQITDTGSNLSVIGTIEAGSELQWSGKDEWTPGQDGFNHFPAQT